MTTWIRIKPYLNYFISDDGRVKNIKTGRILKGWTNQKGYNRVGYV